MSKLKVLESQQHEGTITRPKKHSKIMSEVSFQDNSSSQLKGCLISFDYKKRRRPIDKLNIRSKPISREKSRVDSSEFQIVLDNRR